MNSYWVLGKSREFITHFLKQKIALHWPQTTCEIINQNTELENCACDLGNPAAKKFRDSVVHCFSSWKKLKKQFWQLSLNSDWKIRSYWPVDKQGSGCATFDDLPLSDLKLVQYNMLKQWPNLRNKDKPGKRCFASGEERYWARNWCQHGSIKGRFGTSAEYFRNLMFSTFFFSF